MGIKAAYMVPHPPLIVPAVGRGGEKDITETTRAYERVAEHIAKIAPDTIIITSPHSVMYADYFHISPGTGSAGDFANDTADFSTLSVSLNVVTSIFPSVSVTHMSILEMFLIPSMIFDKIWFEIIASTPILQIV